MDTLKPYYTINEIADKLNLKYSMIYKLIKKNLLPAIRCGNKFLLQLDDVQECFSELKNR